MKESGLGLGKGIARVHQREGLHMEWEVGKIKSMCTCRKTNFVKYGLILRIPFKPSSSAAHGFPHLPSCFSDLPEIFSPFWRAMMTASPDTINVCNHPVVPFI